MAKAQRQATQRRPTRPRVDPSNQTRVSSIPISPSSHQSRDGREVRNAAEMTAFSSFLHLHGLLAHRPHLPWANRELSGPRISMLTCCLNSATSSTRPSVPSRSMFCSYLECFLAKGRSCNDNNSSSRIWTRRTTKTPRTRCANNMRQAIWHPRQNKKLLLGLFNPMTSQRAGPEPGLRSRAGGRVSSSRSDG